MKYITSRLFLRIAAVTAVTAFIATPALAGSATIYALFVCVSGYCTNLNLQQARSDGSVGITRQYCEQMRVKMSAAQTPPARFVCASLTVPAWTPTLFSGH